MIYEDSIPFSSAFLDQCLLLALSKISHHARDFAVLSVGFGVVHWDCRVDELDFQAFEALASSGSSSLVNRIVKSMYARSIGRGLLLGRMGTQVTKSIAWRLWEGYWRPWESDDDY